MSTQRLDFDDGLTRLDVNGNGLLTFNPSDFNLYERFFALSKSLPELEQKYVREVETIPDNLGEEEKMELIGEELTLAKAIDTELKAKLSHVFGAQNDFDKLLGGVNLMAIGNNGERVITNLLQAIAPYIQQGVNRQAKSAADKAQRNREQRRAAQRAQR